MNVKTNALNNNSNKRKKQTNSHPFHNTPTEEKCHTYAVVIQLQNMNKVLSKEMIQSFICIILII